MESYNIDEMVHNIHKTFEELKFESEAHEYTVQDRKLKSVSHFIKDYCEVFESERIATMVAKKTGRTVEEVLQEWEDIKNQSCDLGTATHLFGENLILTGEGLPSNGYEQAIVRFWKELEPNFIPVILELQMYCPKLGLAGTSDIILFNKNTGKFVIADYKTNKDLFKNFKGKKLLRPFNDMLDMPHSKYTIQLATYQILFELTGYEVEDRFLIWVKPDGMYEIHHTPDIRDQINNLYDF